MSTVTAPRADHKMKASTLPQAARPPTRKPRGLKAFWRRLSQSPKPEDRAKTPADHAKFRPTVSAQSLEAVLHTPRGGDGSRSPSSRKTPRATPEKRKSSFGAFFSAFTQCKSGGDSVKRRKTSKTSSGNGSGAAATTPGSHGNGELRPDYKFEDIPATIVPTITSQDIKSISSSPRVTARATSIRAGARPHSSACITSSALGSTATEGAATSLPLERPDSLHVLGSAPEQQLLVTARSSAVPEVMPAHVSSTEASAPHHRHQLTESSIDSVGACSIDVHPATSPTAFSTRSFESSGSAQPGSEQSRSPVSRSSLGRAPPSYLGIACAVSGYSSINRYDSSVREGFRSRDCSPAPGRLAFARSRDSSPLRERLKSPENKSTPQETAVRISELKAQLARCARELGGQLEERSRQNSIRRRDKKPPSGRSVSVDRGYLTKASEIHTGASQGYGRNGHRTSVLSPDYGASYTRDTTTSKQRQNYFSGGNMTSHQIPVRLIDTPPSFNGHISSPLSLHSDALDNHIENTKSFIRERIERLYGPGALAAGFTRRSPQASSGMGNSVKRSSPQARPEGRIIPIQLEYNDEVDKQSKDEPGRGMPSVFRHLRPEFRYQLPVKSPVSPSSSSSSNKKSDTVSITNGHHHTKEIPIEVLARASSAQPKETSPVTTEILSTNKASTNSNKDDERSSKVIDVAVAPSSVLNVEDNKSYSVEEAKFSKEVAENSVPLPHNGCGTSSLRNKVSPEPEAAAATPSSDVKNGHYFMKIVDAEVESLEKEVALLEKDLEEQGSQMTEEVRGKLLATTGKTKLLISQKIKQFKGLCQKNIAGQQEGDEFPTTCEDLAGFWDMVSLQVEDVRDMLRAAARLKANAWTEPAVDSVDAGSSCQPSTSSRASAGRSARRVKPAPSAATSEAAKAKDEARKKAAEERRKAMREAMKAKRAAAAAENKGSKQDNSVEIFVPET